MKATTIFHIGINFLHVDQTSFWLDTFLFASLCPEDGRELS